MDELAFFKMYPRSDSHNWRHPSAVWAAKECYALQVYIGRGYERGPYRWRVVLDRSASQEVPEWIEKLALQGATSLVDPDTTLLFPGVRIGSLFEAKAALELARARVEEPSALARLMA